MTRDEFRQRMELYRSAREQNPQLSYWEWKASKYRDGTDYVTNTNLPEVIVTPDRNYVNQPFDRDAYNSAMLDAWGKQTRMSTDALSYLPIVGDVMDSYNIGKDFYNGDLQAGAIGLGMMLLPNLIEKPLKSIGKVIRNLTERSVKSANHVKGNNINYNSLTSNEQNKVNNTITNAFKEYVDYLNNPIIERRIIDSEAAQYLPVIQNFKNKLSTISSDKPFGDLKISFKDFPEGQAASVPGDKGLGDFIFSNKFAKYALRPGSYEILKDIPRHEASHYFERALDNDFFTTQYNEQLKDADNMKSFDKWFHLATKFDKLPNAILPSDIKYKDLTNADKKRIKNIAESYYYYITDPSEIHSYLGEITRNNLEWKGKVFPYNHYTELIDDFSLFNDQVRDIYTIYKDRNRWFDNLKNNLWMPTIGVASTINYLFNEEDKSN